MKSTGPFSNHEIVTLAVFLLGGESARVDTEDIAIKANQLAPQRFTWRKYPEQINIDTVRKRLWDAQKPQKGGYLSGSEKAGWTLTQQGLEFALARIGELNGVDLTRRPLSTRERNWQRAERARMLDDPAFHLFASGDLNRITRRQAEAFFRVDDYVTGKAREQRITRIKNVFRGDPTLGNAVEAIAEKLRSEV